MSILIRGMEMPENCYRCLFFRMTSEWNKNDEADILFHCVRTGEKTWDYNGGYLPNCPLVPVPPHGRLIDADAAITDIRGEILEHQMNGMKGTPFYIEDLRTMWQRLEDEEMCPTIIPVDPPVMEYPQVPGITPTLITPKEGEA